MLFSILIPVYNAEKYIEETFYSALEQDFDDYEIVLLDDGSTDSSADICERLTETHSERARMLPCEHRGALFARRVLAESAAGEYLVFLDADDLLSPNALSVLSDCIKTTGADMVLYDLYKKSPRGDELFTLPLDDNSTYSGEGKQRIYELLLTTKYLNSLCTKAVKKELFDFKCDYSEYASVTIGEDCFQSYPVLNNANLIVYKKQVLYTYMKNDTGITGTASLNSYDSLLAVHNREIEYADRWRVSQDVMRSVWTNQANFFCNFITLSAQKASKSGDKHEFFSFVRRMTQTPLFNNCLHKAGKINHINRLRLNLAYNGRLKRLYYLEECARVMYSAVTRIKHPTRSRKSM